MKLQFISKRYEIGLWFLWNVNRNIDRSVSVMMTLDLKGGTRGIKFIRRVSLKTLVLFDIERPG